MILMATMLVAAAVSTNAQARFEAGTVTLQPRIGGTGAMFTNAPKAELDDGRTIDATAAGGSFVGVDLEYYLSSRVGLAAGVNYSEAGTGFDDYKYTQDGVKYDVKEAALKTGYVSVPLTVNWYVARGLALKTGLQAGFLVSAKDYMRAEYSAAKTDITLTAKTDIKDRFKKFDLSIPVGLSYDFKLPFVIDFRYNIGLTKVNKEPFDGKDCHNMQAVLTVGYKFKL